MEEIEHADKSEVRHYYVMWCQPCGTAGLDSLDCCEKLKKEIGWVEATETTGTQG